MNTKKKYLVIVAYGIVFLFLVQMITTLVESIYIMDLLQQALDEKAAGVLFLLSPALLLLFGKRVPRRLVWLSCGVLVVARGVTPYFGTLGRLVAAGLGTGAGLILVPVMLSSSPDLGEGDEGLAPAQGLALAVGLSVLLRTLGFTVDSSMTAGGSWIGWLLGVVLAGLIGQFSGEKQTDRDSEVKGTLAAGIGLVTILTLVYFVFSSPGVMARWTEGNYPLIVIGVSFMSLLWCGLSLSRPSLLGSARPSLVNALNVLFLLSLCGTILAHTVAFPAGPDAPVVVVASPRWYQQVPMLLVLILFPVIFIDFSLLAGVMVRKRPSPRKAASGFLLGSLFLLILVFMNIFTNVWGYVQPVSGYMRNRYWLPFFLICAVIAAVSAAHLRRRPLRGVSRIAASKLLVPAVLLCAVFVVTVVGALVTDRVTREAEYKDSLTVMTYNIQQGNDDRGEKAHEGQIALIRRVNPDVVGLQECDSSRISLGNTDLVRYCANELGYYSYYGPTTVTGSFGTAVLSKYPLSNCVSFFTFSDQEEIGTAQAEIGVGGRRFTIFNVHPDGSDEVMRTLIEAVLERAAGKENVIALGDYNLREGEDAYQLIDGVYKNAWMDAYPTGIDDKGLDMSGRRRIDHVFVSPHLEVRNPVYLPAPGSRTDHPAHWTEIVWE